VINLLQLIKDSKKDEERFFFSIDRSSGKSLVVAPTCVYFSKKVVGNAYLFERLSLRCVEKGMNSRYSWICYVHDAVAPCSGLMGLLAANQTMPASSAPC
jgi:hypothetical protein